MKIYLYGLRREETPLKARKVTSLKRQYISIAELTGDSFFGKALVASPIKRYRSINFLTNK